MEFFQKFFLKKVNYKKLFVYLQLLISNETNMSGINQGSYRNVRINFGTAVDDVITVPAAPLDFYKAVTHWVAQNEYEYNQNPTTKTDLTAVSVRLTSKHAPEIFKATVTVDISEGLYSFTFVEAGQTIEDVA